MFSSFDLSALPDMRHMKNSILSVAILAACTTSTLAATQIYDTPGTYQWTVPVGVTSMRVMAIGGGGGGAGGSNGGPGGSVTNNAWQVTPGDTINIVVGGGGGSGSDWDSAAGGGASSLSIGGSNWIIAGGGGGGGSWGFIYESETVVRGGAGGDGCGGNGASGDSAGGSSGGMGGWAGSNGNGGATSPVGGPGGSGNGGAGGNGVVRAAGSTLIAAYGGFGAGTGTGGSAPANNAYVGGGGGGGYGGGGTGGKSNSSIVANILYTSGSGGGGGGGSTGGMCNPSSNGGASAATGTQEGSSGGNGSVQITVPSSLSGSIAGLTSAGLTLTSGTIPAQTISPVVNATSFIFATNFIGAYTVTVQTQPEGQTCTVSNASGMLDGANVSNVVVSCVNDLRIIRSTFGPLQVGIPVNLTLEAAGGVGGYTWSAFDTNQPLPAGLNLSVGGVLSGTPTTQGTYSSLITVTDESGATLRKALGDPVTKVFSGEVKAASAVVTPATPVPTLGEWGLIALSSLLAMLGLARSRRREG